MDSRLTDLEIRLTHQEAAIDEMNQVLLKQYSLIEKLQNEISSLQRHFRESSNSGIADSSQETPPPHY